MPPNIGVQATAYSLRFAPAAPDTRRSAHP